MTAVALLVINPYQDRRKSLLLLYNFNLLESPWLSVPASCIPHWWAQTLLPPTNKQQPCTFSIYHLEPKFGRFLPRPASVFLHSTLYRYPCGIFWQGLVGLCHRFRKRVVEYPCISTGHQTRKKYTGFEVRWACFPVPLVAGPYWTPHWHLLRPTWSSPFWSHLHFKENTKILRETKCVN